MNLPAFLILLLSAAFAAADPPGKLAEYEAAFKAKQAELDARYHSTVTTTRKQYEQALTRLSASFQAKGKLTEVIRVRDEIARVGKSGAVTKADLADTPVELRKLQLSCIQAIAKATAERNLGRSRLLQTYIKALDKLKTELTKASDIEGAVTVQARAREVQHIAAELLAGINPVTGAPRFITRTFKLDDLEAFKKDWRLKGSNFNAGADGLKGPKGPANEIESLFKLKGDFEVSLAFNFGRAAYTNTGGSWIQACGERLHVAHGWGGFKANIKLQRKGNTLIFTNNDKVTEVEIKPENRDAPTSFYLWWRSRSFHFKELTVKTDRFIRE